MGVGRRPTDAVILFIRYSRRKNINVKTNKKRKRIIKCCGMQEKNLIWVWIRYRRFQPEGCLGRSKSRWSFSLNSAWAFLGLEAPILNPYPYKILSYNTHNTLFISLRLHSKLDAFIDAFSKGADAGVSWSCVAEEYLGGNHQPSMSDPWLHCPY